MFVRLGLLPCAVFEMCAWPNVSARHHRSLFFYFLVFIKFATNVIDGLFGGLLRGWRAVSFLITTKSQNLERLGG
jgi:hypothetical protein